MKDKQVNKNNSKIKSKLGLGPVLITMMIFAFVIGAVVTYNVWFQGYSQDMQNDVQEKTKTIPVIENVYGNSIYLRNTFDKSFVMDKLEIDKIVCSTNDTLKPGINEVDISICMQTIKTGKHTVIMFSSYGVYSKEIYFDSIKSTLNQNSFDNPFVIGDFKPEGKLTDNNNGCLELQNIGNNLSGNYYLIKDIYCENTTLWNNGKGFIPIGNNSNPFIGTLDGRGYTIYQLYIDSDEKETGLFSSLNNAQISNLNIITNLITGDDKNIGGLSGVIENSIITDVHIRGNISGNKKEVGGLSGSVTNSTISKSSYSDGTVIGDRKSAGGLVGICDNCIIDNSYSNGNVVGNKDYVGGFIGTAIDSTISNSYSTGSVISNQGQGGFIGDSLNSQINDSYWDIQTSLQVTSDGGVGKNTNQMRNQTTFNNWDFVNIWTINQGVNYPQLR